LLSMIQLTAPSKILACLHQRLNSIHAHYLWMHQTAVGTGSLIPNTAPMNAAPNRRFVIMRAERPSPLLTAFDLSNNTASLKRSLLIEQLCSPDFTVEEMTDLDSGRPQTSMSNTSTDDDIEDSPKRWTGGGLLRSIIGNSRPQSRSKSQSPSRFRVMEQPRPPTSTPEGLSRNSSLSNFSLPDDNAIAVWKRQQSNSMRPYCFRFSLELVDKSRNGPSQPMQLTAPRLPQPAQRLLLRYLHDLAVSGRDSTSSDSDATSGNTGKSRFSDERALEELVEEARPMGAWTASSVLPRHTTSQVLDDWKAYCGRGLAEWAILVNECHLFYERRKAEGVPGNRYVEAPILGTEAVGRGPKG